MNKTKFSRIISVLLASAMLLSACDNARTDTDDDTGSDTFDISDNSGNTDTDSSAGNETDVPYSESFSYVSLPEVENWDGVHITSVGVLDGDAVLYDNGISLVYDEELGQNVLSMTGDEGYLKLPNDIWKYAENGFTVSFCAKPASDVKNDANLFQTNLCGYGVGDTSWRDAPEISLNTSGDLRIYVGGRTINGTYNAIATYNNGGAGDSKDYAEPHGFKPRYNATTTAISKGEWSEIVLSFSEDAVSMYVNGEEVKVNRVSSEQSSLKSALKYLFGNYDNGEYILGQYVNTSIGNSVYSDTNNYKGLLGNIRIYNSPLSAEEAKKTAPTYLWNFNGDCILEGEAIYATEDDLMHYGDRELAAMDGLKTVSPDGKTTVDIRYDEDGTYYYSVIDEGTVLVMSSKIGMQLKGCDLSTGLTLVTDSVKTDYKKETYSLITGMNAEALNEYNETRFTLENSSGGSFDFVIRVHDDGVAYKYENVTSGTADVSEVTVEKEFSEVIIPDNSTTWSHLINATYESEYTKRNSSQLESLTAKLSTPLLVHHQNHWMLITQAGIINNNAEYSACGLMTESGSLSLRWQFGLDRDPKNEATGELDRPGHIDITSIKTVDGFSTPWRVIVISTDLEEFTQTSIMTDLNPDPDPELFADTSYIKPGRVAWSWWSEDGEQSNYSKHIEYIDFAAENGWEYVCLDAYWRAFESRLGEMCDYAKSKGVGLFVWVNYRDIKNEENMEKLFKSWADAGVVGLKTDYFESDAPNVLGVMEKTAVCAAKNRLMVLYHGCVHPGGESRTYPNIMTTEAVLGAENHKWSNVPTITNCLLYPFTRNICGSMDYTPVATKISSSDASNGFALAMTVVYESGLQHLAYSAAGYKLYNGLSFLNNLAVEWDSSEFIEGFPGEYITVARRSGETWYIGSMTDEARTVSVPLDFLDGGTYNAYIYHDSADGSRLVIDSAKVTSSDTLTLDLVKAGGAAVIITKDVINTEIVGVIDPDNYTYYEAESSANKLSGTAVKQSSATCSGGTKVGYIGNGAANTLTFNKVTVEKDGTYRILVYYCCGESRKLILTVNNDVEYTLTKLNSGSYTNPTFAEIEVELKAGENSIMLSQPSYYAPDIDCIAVHKTAE